MLRDSRMVNLLACMLVCAIFPILPGAHQLEFSCAIASYLRHLPNYGTYAISCDSVTASFLTRSCALPNSLALWGAHRLQFSHATASNIRHFVQLGYPCDFASSREGQSFSTRVRVRQFPSPLGNALVGIFTRDHFFSLSFGLIRVPVRFHVITRW